jgi:hypothetical protein
MTTYDGQLDPPGCLLAGMIVGDDVPEYRRRTTINYNKVRLYVCLVDGLCITLQHADLVEHTAHMLNPAL